MSSIHCNSVCKLAENWCNTEVQLHKVKYVWKISNFDFHEAEGSELISPTFSAITDRQVKWFFILKPNGETDAKDNISFYIKSSRDSISDSTDTTIYAKSSAFVLDRHQKEIYCKGSSNIDKAQMNVYSFSPGSSSSWGRKEFLKKNDSFRNDLLCNNELTIICTLLFSPVRNALTNAVHSCNVASLYPNVPECDPVENFGTLLENRQFADIILCVKNGKKEYPAHKVILTARSSVFAAMFNHNFKENETSRIEIEDMNEEVLTEMLRYIYTGKCENTDKLADGLLAVADKYDLNRLKMICAEALYKTLSVDNAANILSMADLHCVKELKSETIKFIIAKFSGVLKTASWKNISASNPELINEVCQAVADRLTALSDGK